MTACGRDSSVRFEAIPALVAQALLPVLLRVRISYQQNPDRITTLPYKKRARTDFSGRLEVNPEFLGRDYLVSVVPAAAAAVSNFSTRLMRAALPRSPRR
jgi:hypothetical protein